MSLTSAFRVAARYVGDVMGDNDYGRYVEFRRRTHPGEPIMSEREYWRTRHDESSVTVRCC